MRSDNQSQKRYQAGRLAPAERDTRSLALAANATLVPRGAHLPGVLPNWRGRHCAASTSDGASTGPATPSSSSRAGAARAARAPEVASLQFPIRANGGGASYGYAVQSECNTRGFGGAGVAPPPNRGHRSTATFHKGTRRVRAPLSQSGARESGQPKATTIPEPPKVWEKIHQ
jgi:hypothetical protein